MTKEKAIQLFKECLKKARDENIELFRFKYKKMEFETIPQLRMLRIYVFKFKKLMSEAYCLTDNEYNELVETFATIRDWKRVGF